MAADTPVSSDAEQAQLLELVRKIHRRKRGSYGSRRMARELSRRGYAVGRHRARTLMRRP